MGITQSPSGWYTKLPQKLRHFAMTIECYWRWNTSAHVQMGQLSGIIGLPRCYYFMEMS